MNAGNRRKAWLKYCLDSEVKDSFRYDSECRAELRETKDKPCYNPKMLVLIFYKNEKIDETMSENEYTKDELLSIWNQQKSYSLV